MIAQIIETDETLTPIAAGAVTDADIRAGCLIVAERTNLAEEQRFGGLQSGLGRHPRSRATARSGSVIAGNFSPLTTAPASATRAVFILLQFFIHPMQGTSAMGWLYMQSLKGHSGPRQYLDAQFTFERSDGNIESAALGARRHARLLRRRRTDRIFATGEHEVFGADLPRPLTIRATARATSSVTMT